MVAFYMGITSENEILNMSYTFFNSLLKCLDKRLKYDAAVGYAGNSFFKESSELINASNPLRGDAKGKGNGEIEGIAVAINMANEIKIIDAV